MTTTNNDESKLDNATVRRFAKLLKNNTKTASPVVTGTVIQNGNEISVAVDSETIVPITDTNTNVNVGDKVTLSFNDDKALIIGNITDTNPTTSEVENIDTKATTAQETATTATKKAETAQKRAEGAEKVATNYIDIDENKGITVGNIADGTVGKNAYIDANGFYIRDNTTELASFEDNEITFDKGQLSVGTNTETSAERTQIYSPTRPLIVKTSSEKNTNSSTEIKNCSTNSDGFSNSLTLSHTPNQDSFILSACMGDSDLFHPAITGTTSEDGSTLLFSALKYQFLDTTASSSAELLKEPSFKGHTHTTSDISDVDTLAKAEHVHSGLFAFGSGTSASFTAKAYAWTGWIQITPPNKDGYTAIGISGVGVSNSWISIPNYYINNGIGWIGVQNSNANDIAITASMDFIYVKSDFL